MADISIVDDIGLKHYDAELIKWIKALINGLAVEKPDEASARTASANTHGVFFWWSDE